MKLLDEAAAHAAHMPFMPLMPLMPLMPPICRSYAVHMPLREWGRFSFSLIKTSCATTTRQKQRGHNSAITRWYHTIQ